MKKVIVKPIDALPFEAEELSTEGYWVRVRDENLDVSWHYETFVVDLENEEFKRKTGRPV